MANREALSVNLDDLQDIREKLPRIRQRRAEKQRELEALQAEVHWWSAQADSLAARIREQAPSPVPADTPPQRAAPAQERAIKALEKAGRPMGPSALYRFMVGEGLDAKNANAVGANLWAAAKAGRIKQNPDGAYVPLSWEPDESSDDHHAGGSDPP
jgi:hypothetical protein